MGEPTLREGLLCCPSQAFWLWQCMVTTARYSTRATAKCKFQGERMQEEWRPPSAPTQSTQAELKGKIIYTSHMSYCSADKSQKADWDVPRTSVAATEDR